MPQEPYETMLLVQNPPEYITWPQSEKLAFYENVVRWHEYISELMKAGEVTRAWGAEKLPGRVRPNATKTLLIAIYKTTFARFTELITRDPLWDSAWYQGHILKSIEGDYEDDVKRVGRQRASLEKKLGKKLTKLAAKYQGKRPDIKPGGDIDVLVSSTNEPAIGLLSEEERLAQDELVLQMHDYHQPFREAGIIVHDWGTYQNCGFGVTDGANRQRGVYITRVNSYDEFDDFFQAHPRRVVSIVHTVVLVPFEESCRRAEQELKETRERFGPLR